MCLAIPAKVLSINGTEAGVEVGGVSRTISVMPLSGLILLSLGIIALLGFGMMIGMLLVLRTSRQISNPSRPGSITSSSSRSGSSRVSFLNPSSAFSAHTSCMPYRLKYACSSSECFLSSSISNTLLISRLYVCLVPRPQPRNTKKHSDTRMRRMIERTCG